MPFMDRGQLQAEATSDKRRTLRTHHECLTNVSRMKPVCSTTSLLTRLALGVTDSRVIEQLIELGTVQPWPRRQVSRPA
jgi:hypothetical protein